MESITRDYESSNHQSIRSNLVASTPRHQRGGFEPHTQFLAPDPPLIRHPTAAPANQQNSMLKTSNYASSSTRRNETSNQPEPTPHHRNNGTGTAHLSQSLQAPRPIRSPLRVGVPIPATQAQRMFASTPSIRVRPQTAQAGSLLPPTSNTTHARFRPVSSAAKVHGSGGGGTGSAPRRFAPSAG